MRYFRALIGNRSGATAIEYSLLAAIIGMTLAIALSSYYDTMNNLFGGIANTYTTATQ